jgi:hypothetical protein
VRPADLGEALKTSRIETRIEPIEVETEELRCEGCGRITDQFPLGRFGSDEDDQPMPDGWIIVHAWRFPFRAQSIDLCPDCIGPSIRDALKDPANK